MDRALSHFLDLASRGLRVGRSSGELAAWRLAKAVVDSVPRLDGLARDGLRQFINLASNSPGTARDLLQGGSDDEG
jgi:hypothetical protein